MYVVYVVYVVEVKEVTEITEVKEIVEVMQACLGPGGENWIINVMFILKSHVLPLQYSNYTQGATSVLFQTQVTKICPQDEGPDSCFKRTHFCSQ